MGLGVNEMSKLTVDAQIHDLEYQAQNINRQKLAISQQLEENAKEYEAKTSNRQMKIGLFLSATGVNKGNTDTTKTMNLTYARLVSATVSGLETGVAGIQAYSKTKNQSYTSNNYFRLTDPDGAIVVSSIEEIPGVIVNTTTENVANSPVPKKDANGTMNQSALTTALETLSNIELTYDSENGVVKVKGKDGSEDYEEYFNLADGTQYTDDTKTAIKAAFKKATSDYKIEIADANGKSYCKVTQERKKETVVYAQGAKGLLKGQDGTYELVDEKGTPITGHPKYRVDSMLTCGFSENGESTDGPNYLQDCIRNGKYMLQVGNMDNDEKSFKWSNVSWDSITSINDNYYTEDDDAAKAKYDRIQTQLNAQEKKLDLQLDTIETERSALTQQKESIDKCLEDNMDSFKTFA